VAGFGGQQAVAPILPALARTLGLTEFQTGLLLSVSALGFMTISPLWGRGVTRWGAKPVITWAMVGVAFSLLCLAVAAQVSLRYELSPGLTFWLLLGCRGLGVGVAASAIPVAAQASLAHQTTSQTDRVRAMGAYGAAFGLAGVIGPALGGLLASGGLLVPLYVPPGLVLGAAVVVWLRMRPGDKAPQRRRGVAATSLVPRVWPFLLAGFALFLALMTAPFVLGFLIQDRFEVGAEQAAQQTGVALLGYGVASFLTQALVVGRLRWSPNRLLKIGIPLSAVAFVGMAAAPNLAVIVATTVLFGLGGGLAIPGYVAAPTLLVGPDEQGRLAGLITSVNGAGTMAGPLAAAPLYELAPAVPLIACAVMLAVLTAFVHVRLTHRLSVRADRGPS
jgi:MFS family permease